MQESKADFSTSVSVTSKFLLCGHFLPLTLRCPVKVLIDPKLCCKGSGTRCGTEETSFVVFVYTFTQHHLCCNTNNTSLRRNVDNQYVLIKASSLLIISRLFFPISRLPVFEVV